MGCDERIEELIREVAARHGIALGRDDPILVLETVNRRLMQDSAASQQQQLEAFRSEMESIALRWTEDARSKSESMLSAALAASQDALTRSLQDCAQAAGAAMRRETAEISQVLAHRIGAARTVALMNMAAAALSVAAAALVLWAVR